MSQPFVIEITNRPGELAHLARALAVRGINIVHLAASSSGETMSAMLTTDDDASTRDVLTSMGAPFVEGDTLHVEIPDRPGSIAALAELLAGRGVNITGILIVGRRGPMCEVAFGVDDEGRAREALGLPPVHSLPARP